MARRSNSGTYLLVDNVRVWYDPNTDTTHVTSDDPDFGPGIHITLKRWSGPDKRIREAFLAAGLHPEALPDKPVPLPQFDIRDNRLVRTPEGAVTYDSGEGTQIA